MWCVESRGGLWCAAKSQTVEPDAGTSVATACDHYVTLPIGIRRSKHPTCVDCRAALRSPKTSNEEVKERSSK